ncbi:uncharacterized protein LOC101755388 isoform X3 [Setaria italica]|uniref:uncharacterized protein LOC101755388 isoform X3 n=1 Tax=Setaria italica TaxID=4555 RepID=UPI000BE56C8E|nr:uncharacterized protein LOC101755388 isoform X3 [Setaria italica]
MGAPGASHDGDVANSSTSRRSGTRYARSRCCRSWLARFPTIYWSGTMFLKEVKAYPLKANKDGGQIVEVAATTNMGEENENQDSSPPQTQLVATTAAAAGSFRQRKSVGRIRWERGGVKGAGPGGVVGDRVGRQRRGGVGLGRGGAVGGELASGGSVGSDEGGRWGRRQRRGGEAADREEDDKVQHVLKRAKCLLERSTECPLTSPSSTPIYTRY